MKIHSDILTASDIRECVPRNCFLATMEDGTIIRHNKSRSRKVRFEIRLSGTSRFTMDSRNLMVAHKSATWDEWGQFIHALLKRDPEAIVGSYKGMQDFISQTCEVYNAIKLNRSDKLHTHTAPWLVKN